ncbi:MAG TPA: methyltransferase domain-containing protein [Haliangiales bacterium]|nr:methyltransferase domain-containing protein [Haliangiales bacterium]
MARETRGLNHEVLAALGAADGERILEVGFGHGRTLAEAAGAAPRAAFAGIDASAKAARVAARRCRDAIARGRIDLRVGDSAALPWPGGAFDKAFSVHTLYFWQEPRRDLGELRRVLAPGGLVVLGFRERSDAAVATFPGYRFYTAEQLAELLAAAGFHDLAVRPVSGDLRVARARTAR